MHLAESSHGIACIASLLLLLLGALVHVNDCLEAQHLIFARALEACVLFATNGQQQTSIKALIIQHVHDHNKSLSPLCRNFAFGPHANGHKNTPSIDSPEVPGVYFVLSPI